MANEIDIYDPRTLVEVVRTTLRSTRSCVTAFSLM